MYCRLVIESVSSPLRNKSVSRLSINNQRSPINNESLITNHESQIANTLSRDASSMRECREIDGDSSEHDAERERRPDGFADDRAADQIGDAGDEDGGKHRIARHAIRARVLGHASPYAIQAGHGQTVARPDPQHERN